MSAAEHRNLNPIGTFFPGSSGICAEACAQSGQFRPVLADKLLELKWRLF
jgi:hypothetical protein